tara:strand:- start:142 stop:1314 length:1173 start_codon:yes stop_codon:yes gene_type:complete
MNKLKAYWHSSIEDLSEETWELVSCKSSNPFLKWSWLSKLEKSESICADKGWQPLHLSIWEGNNIIGIAPLYLKSHSYGEFIFDNIFVDLSRELGLKYYPKLIGMSPLSPIQGYKFLICKEEDEEELTALMLQLIEDFANKNGILSCNFLHTDPDWTTLVEKYNYSKWLHQYSLWMASDSKNFADYLSKFNSNQRRNIKRERKKIQESGFKINILEGSSINENIMDNMYNLYSLHCSKWGPWGSKYLSKEFFKLVANSALRENLVLFSAHKESLSQPVAMSMCVRDQDMLWGRYWGSEVDADFLHFELCYYSPISWALENQIKFFDPGAGGKHKSRRGFVSKERASIHKWFNPTLNKLIKTWLPKANQMMREKIDLDNDSLPFTSQASKI